MGKRHRTAADDRFDSSDPRIGRTRAAVHEAGLEILFASGPTAITHAALAAATGMSRTTLYKHWPSRVDLLVDVCAQVEQGDAAELTGDIRADLVTMVGEMAQTLSDPRARQVFSALLAQAQMDPEALEVSNALAGTGLANMSAVLESAATSGQLPAGLDAAEVAGRLLGPLLFGALVTHRDAQPAEIESIVDTWLSSVQST